MHGFVTAHRLAVGSVRVAQCDDEGRWCRARDPLPDEIPDELASVLRDEGVRAGEALRAIGYRGPFSIDGFCWSAAACGVDVRWQTCCDLNARFTMDWWSRGRELADQLTSSGVDSGSDGG